MACVAKFAVLAEIQVIAVMAEVSRRCLSARKKKIRRCGVRSLIPTRHQVVFELEMRERQASSIMATFYGLWSLEGKIVGSKFDWRSEAADFFELNWA